MSIIIRQAFPRIFPVFVNQIGSVILGDVDGTTYLADTGFFNSCFIAEAERNGSVPLMENDKGIQSRPEKLPSGHYGR